jgi:23S rRNA pseudouridine955/2504/2580 synthase
MKYITMIKFKNNEVENMELINIGKNDKGKRIDSFLKKIMRGAPESLVYKYIRTNKIKINGKKPAPDTRLCEGDVISYYGDSSLIAEKKFLPSSYSVDVLYEDENILAVFKPAGMACQPDARHKDNTLVDNIKNYLYEKGDYRPLEENSFAPALCNRIDFNTSGICVAAKNAESLRTINEKIKNREIRKFYMCVTEGVPPRKSGTIKKRIMKNAAINKAYISEEGKEAETRYKVLMEKDGRTLLELEIITGRTHQIRLHMSSIGCPVLNDPKYGRGGKGQKLVAYKIMFDFKVDAGILENLKGKTIEIPVSDLDL